MNVLVISWKHGRGRLFLTSVGGTVDKSKPVNKVCTVKFGDKERFDKEQIGVKELLPTLLYHKFTVR